MGLVCLVLFSLVLVYLVLFWSCLFCPVQFSSDLVNSGLDCVVMFSSDVACFILLCSSFINDSWSAALFEIALTIRQQKSSHILNNMLDPGFVVLITNTF